MSKSINFQGRGDSYLEKLLNNMLVSYYEESGEIFENPNTDEVAENILFSKPRKEILNVLENILKDDQKINVLAEEVQEKNNGSLDLGVYKHFVSYNTMKLFINNLYPLLSGLGLSNRDFSYGRFIFPIIEMDTTLITQIMESFNENLANIESDGINEILSRKYRTIFGIAFKRHKMTLMTDEQFRELLDDRLIFKINLNLDFNSLSVGSFEFFLIDYIATIFLIESRFKEQFSHILKEKDLEDFDMSKYNIEIDSPFKDLLMSIYAFIKQTLRINKPSIDYCDDRILYRSNFAKEFSSLKGKGVLTTLIPIDALDPLGNKSNPISKCLNIANILKYGNSYTSKACSLTADDFILAKLLILDEDAETVLIKIYYPYTEGKYREALFKLPFTSIVPFISPDVRTSLYSLFYTGDINNVDEQYNKQFMFLSKGENKEELEKSIELLVKEVITKFKNSALLVDIEDTTIGKYSLNTDFNTQHISIFYPSE